MLLPATIKQLLALLICSVTMLQMSSQERILDELSQNNDALSLAANEPPLARLLHRTPRTSSPHANIFDRRRYYNDTAAIAELPTWLESYVKWHREQIAMLTPDNWQQSRYLVLRCLEGDAQCGGLADRLKPIPNYLKVAQMTTRILLIIWERPAPLETFLVPTQHGIDWVAPEWLRNKIVSQQLPHADIVGFKPKNVERLRATTSVMSMKAHATTEGMEAFWESYSLSHGEMSFARSYPAVWNMMFHPHAAVRERIDSEMIGLGLNEYQYVAIHSRTVYDIQPTPEEVRQRMLLAVDCAVYQNKMTNGGPTKLFVATDNSFATDVALQYGRRLEVAAVTQQGGAALHLDRGSDFLLQDGVSHSDEHHAVDYYAIFVDLYLLSQARCIGFDIGSFGHWAVLLAGPRCSFRHDQIGTCPSLARQKLMQHQQG